MAKILLVEDEANIRSFIGRGLTEFGHAVTTAGDGASAWERIAQERFDLLVMDIMMPKISGLDLCRRFRQYYGYAVPVLMLTALGTTEDIVRGSGGRSGRLSGQAVQFCGIECADQGSVATTGHSDSCCCAIACLRRPGTQLCQPPRRRGTEEVDLTEKKSSVCWSF